MPKDILTTFKNWQQIVGNSVGDSTVCSLMSLIVGGQNCSGQKVCNQIYLLVFSADFGGLIGLFMGCSLLSVLELFYYLFQHCVKRRKSVEIIPQIKIVAPAVASNVVPIVAER